MTSLSNVKTTPSQPSTKNNIDTCILNFSKIVLSTPKSMFVKSMKQIREELIQFSKLGQISENFIRPTAWRLFLNVFPCKEEDVLKSWVTAIKEQRANFKSKTKTYLSLKKLSGDPLGGGGVKEKDEGGWNSFFEESEIKKQISLDVNRTFQEKELFSNQTIKDLMNSILFIWAKENPDPGYKQGMNELLATLINALYPFYFKNSFDKDELNKNMDLYLTEQKKYQKELYYYFHDESEFPSDLYSLFMNLMKCGLTNFFDNPSPKDKDKAMEGDLTYLQKRCKDIIYEKLRLYNKALFEHFVHIDLSCQLFLQRWLKCLFNREFHSKDVEVLWDNILAYEQQEEKNELQMVDYISIAMIVYIKDELMLQDQSECFKRLFTYPPIESGFALIKMSVLIEEEIKKRKIAEEKAVIEKKEKEKREKEEREKKEKEDKEREKRQNEEKDKREKEESDKREKEKEEAAKKQTPSADIDPPSTNNNGSQSKPVAVAKNPLFSPLQMMPSTSTGSTKKDPTPFFSNVAKEVAKGTKPTPTNRSNNANINNPLSNQRGPTETNSNEQFFNKNFNQFTTKELLDKLNVILSKYKNQINSTDSVNIDIIVDALKVRMENKN